MLLICTVKYVCTSYLWEAGLKKKPRGKKKIENFLEITSPHTAAVVDILSSPEAESIR